MDKSKGRGEGERWGKRCEDRRGDGGWGRGAKGERKGG